MTLFEKILAIYPELKEDSNLIIPGYFKLQNDGDGHGDYIAEWWHPTLAQPTQEMLDAWEGV